MKWKGKTKTFDEGTVYYPATDDERKILEAVVEKGLAQYTHGGYMLYYDQIIKKEK